MIKIEIFLNEVSLKGQYSTQTEFEEALKIIKSIFDSINSLKKANIDPKNYYTDVLWDCNAIKDVIFRESFNKIKQKDFKIAIKNIIFNKVNPKDWRTEQIHSAPDYFDYVDGEDYKEAKNTSLAEATERQLINLDSKYLLINFINSCFQCPHEKIPKCNSIFIVKNNDTINLINLDSVENHIGFKSWLENTCRFSDTKYDQNSQKPPTDSQTILRDHDRFEPTNYKFGGRKIYQEKSTGYLWYVDNLHFGQSAHLEVFERTGKRHLGESDLDGNLDREKSDTNKKPIL